MTLPASPNVSFPDIPEFPVFFIRASKVLSGNRKDQETGFPIEYTVTDCNGNPVKRKNRLLKNHFPSEKVFKKFVNSFAGRLAPEHTGSTDFQGLVRIAIGSNIVDRLDSETNTNGDTFTTVVVPSELPVVAAGDNVTVDIEIVRSSDDVVVTSIPVGDRQLYYLRYIINSEPQIDNIIYTSQSPLQVVSSADLDDDNSDLVDIFTSTIPAGFSNGDKLEFDIIWNAGNNSYVRGLYFYLGNNAVSTSNKNIISLETLVPDLQNVKFVAKTKLTIYRYGQNGFQSFAETRFFTHNVATAGTITEGYGEMLLNLMSNPLPESEAFQQVTDTNNPNIDWSLNTIKLFGRFKLNGEAKSTFTSESVTVNGTGFVNG